MNCPKCNGEFESHSIGDLKINECPQHHGLWFNPHELEKATKTVEPDLRWMEFDLWKDQELFDVSEGGLKCPNCHTTMAAVKYGPTQVTVDTCVTCQGIWLDNGEFEQIINALEDQLASMSEDEYRHAALQEARELFTGDEKFVSEWRDLKTVLRLLQYRILIENPKVQEALLALQQSSPFK